MMRDVFINTDTGAILVSDPAKDAPLPLGINAERVTLTKAEADKLATPSARFTYAAGSVVVEIVPPPGPTEAEGATTDLHTTYTAAMARLDAIIAAGDTLTAAQGKTAVTDLARMLRRTLRLLKART